MKYLMLFCFLATPALADDSYNSGYNAGYYSGASPRYEASSYGRGYSDGAYDADQEDRQAQQRSEDFEAALVREQEREYKLYGGAESK